VPRVPLGDQDASRGPERGRSPADRRGEGLTSCGRVDSLVDSPTARPEPR